MIILEDVYCSFRAKPHKKWWKHWFAFESLNKVGFEILSAKAA